MMLASEPNVSAVPKEAEKQGLADSETRHVIHPPNMEPEDALLAAIAANDARKAVRLAAELYAQGVGRLCMAFVRDQGLAEDLTQETFVTALQSFDRYGKTGSFRAYLYGIARHLAIAALEKKRVARAATSNMETAAERSSEDVILAREDRSRLENALGKLRPSDREVLLLRYVTDLEYSEVAIVLSCDEPAVRKRVSRALVSMRAVFFDETK